MNILIIGLGSIGQRHLRNIKQIYPKSNILCYRRKFKVPTLDNLNNVKKINLKKKYKLNYINTLNNLDQFNLDAALICTPSNFHIDEAIKIASQKINIFIEKPLGSSLKKIKKLKNIVYKNKIISMMGFQMRFCPILNKIKKIIKSNKYGKLNQVLIHNGESITNYHNYENYTNSYAAKKELGGGVTLTQIHEIDYFLDLFSEYKIIKLKKFSEKISNLKLNVEDSLISLIKIKKKDSIVLCSLNLNFYEVPAKKTLTLLYEKNKIEADFLKKTLVFEYSKNKKKIIKFKYKRNDLFINEMKYFISHLKKRKKISNKFNIINGIKTLKFAIKLKK
jgi:predicted dehydrogenase